MDNRYNPKRGELYTASWAVIPDNSEKQCFFKDIHSVHIWGNMGYIFGTAGTPSFTGPTINSTFLYSLFLFRDEHTDRKNRRTNSDHETRDRRTQTAPPHSEG
ncbi:hypothetical protein AA21952_2810 [Acetobacter oeni LMG 21952]|nr:hypothetical protein AA21952_2810 [Acetobacter oeni LMG 21952]